MIGGPCIALWCMSRMGCVLGSCRSIGRRFIVSDLFPPSRGSVTFFFSFRLLEVRKSVELFC